MANIVEITSSPLLYRQALARVKRPLSPEIFTTPSGMGGTFDVVVTSDLGDGRVMVRVEMPRNPMWHRFSFITSRAELSAK